MQKITLRCLALIFVVVLPGCKSSRIELNDVFEPLNLGTSRYLPSLFSVDDSPELIAPPLAHRLDESSLRLEAEQCRVRINEAQSSFPLPGAPGLEANRTLVLARAKAEPVLFLRTPEFQGEVSRNMAARRRALLKTKYPRDVYRQILGTFRDVPARLRELVLRDGYFYTDDPRSARLLTSQLKLEALFRGSHLEMLRGSRRLSIERSDKGVYFFASGPEKGQRARLLLFDRIWPRGEDPGPALHVDVRELAGREGIEGMRIQHLGENEIVAEVRFGDKWVPALIQRTGVHLSVDCYLIELDEAVEVGRARDEAYRRSLVLRALQGAIVEQIRLGLPFDEPRTERGQQDGKLRARWESAYFRNRSTYQFNNDRYSVYSETGEAIAPQVCIDFVTETLERASGMHFSPRGAQPEKVIGALDFDEILQTRRRQELGIRDYARLNPHRLGIVDFPLSQWVRYEKINQFFSFVDANKDELRPGDIVIIRGRAAWDRYKNLHSHTFFIYESDPLTSMPMLLAGNAGKPRIVTWDDEMLRAPKRSIRHRIRPNMEWLYDHLVLRMPLRGEQWAAPLSVSER